MKIVVAFFGIPRCTAISAPSIEANILAPLRKLGEVEVVYHLYEQKQVSNSRSGEHGQLDPANYTYFQQFRGITEVPGVAHEGDALNKWKSFGDAFADDFASLRNLRSQLYSLLQVSRLVESTNPDVVLFIRPDLLYHDPIPARLIEIAQENPKACIIPDWQWWGGYNDRFSICGRDAYWSYGTRIRQVINFCTQHQSPLHSESLVRYALKADGLKLYTTGLQASRVRVSGETKIEEFNPLSTLKGDRWLNWEHRLANWRTK